MQEQRGRAALAVGTILWPYVLFLQSASELGSSTQLLLNCLCSDYHQLAKERARLYSGVRVLSSNSGASAESFSILGPLSVHQ